MTNNTLRTNTAMTLAVALVPPKEADAPSKRQENREKRSTVLKVTAAASGCGLTIGMGTVFVGIGYALLGGVGLATLPFTWPVVVLGLGGVVAFVAINALFLHDSYEGLQITKTNQERRFPLTVWS